MTEAARTPHDPARETAVGTAAGDLFSKFDPLIAERQALLDTGVTDPFAIVMDPMSTTKPDTRRESTSVSTRPTPMPAARTTTDSRRRAAARSLGAARPDRLGWPILVF